MAWRTPKEKVFFQAKDQGAPKDPKNDFMYKGKNFDKSNVQGSINNHAKPSLLSEEEQEALKPKQVKVENPWIYEQTHKEYLSNIKVSAQHSFYNLRISQICICFVRARWKSFM